MAVASTTCVHDFDSRGMRRPVSWVGWNPLASPPQYDPVPTIGGIPFGTSFCIDPRMIAANSGTPAAANSARLFPYVPRTLTDDPRMYRITLENGAGGGARMFQLQADALFFVDDDLTYDRPDDRTIMPTQTYVPVPGATTPTPNGKRQNDGHMSWMATLVPKIDRYSLSFNETYVLSIVMFYDRPADMTVGDPQYERVVTVAAMPGSGITGGEVLLTSTSQTALKVRSNDWIMLSGRVLHNIPHLGPSPPAGTPRWIPVFKWYRVLDTEAEATDDNNDGVWERYVTLMGQDWNAAATEAVIVEGVVGVYEKTIRLE
jgi:hypothetical protein